MQLSTNQDNLLSDVLLKSRNEDFHSQPLEEVRCLPLRVRDSRLFASPADTSRAF